MGAVLHHILVLVREHILNQQLSLLKSLVREQILVLVREHILVRHGFECVMLSHDTLSKSPKLTKLNCF